MALKALCHVGGHAIQLQSSSSASQVEGEDAQVAHHVLPGKPAAGLNVLVGDVMGLITS
jgi:hypothetical protein